MDEQLQQIMKEQSNAHRTPQQIEMKNVRGLGHHSVWTTFLLVPGHSVMARAPSLGAALLTI